MYFIIEFLIKRCYKLLENLSKKPIGLYNLLKRSKSLVYALTIECIKNTNLLRFSTYTMHY